MKVCKNCGYEAETSYKFCTNCGNGEFLDVTLKQKEEKPENQPVLVEKPENNNSIDEQQAVSDNPYANGTYGADGVYRSLPDNSNKPENTYTNVCGIIGFIISLLAIEVSSVLILGSLVAIAGLILSIIGLNKGKAYGKTKLATAGIVISAIFLFVSIGVIVDWILFSLRLI